MSLLAFDLIRCEEKLKRDVKEFFNWEKFGNDLGEPDYRPWNKMMGTGKTGKARSTRSCLDSKRRFEDILYVGGSDGTGEGKGFMGNKTLTGIKL